MAIIDRDTATSTALSDDDLERLAALESPSTPSTPAERTDWSRPALVLLAVLSGAAGVIHIAMVPSHASEWLPEGIAFAVAGWFQIAFACLVLSRPSRLALRVGSLANLLFIGAWVVTRVWGSPFGPEAGVAHDASFVDIVCVLLEAGIVVTAWALLARPSLGSSLSSSALVPLSAIPIAVVVLATAAIASPSASGHGHTSGEMAADGHDHSGTTGEVDDKGLSLLMNGQGEGGGHTHDNSEAPLDEATQRELDAQLAKTQEFVQKYPTVKDAEAAGYRRQGPFGPGLGAHYMKGASVSLASTMTDEALANPTLIYDGIDPDSQLAGFMYNIFSTDTQNPPEGFAGPNDHWHYHTNVCLVFRPDGGVDAPLGADTSAPKSLCDQYKGVLVANTGYMVHVWTVPGWESPQGVFSNVNASITCPNGTYYQVPLEEIGNRSNTCKDVPA
jgi:hypothetical protein